MALSDALTLYGPQTGAAIFFVYELFWPLWDTRLQTLVNSISDDIEGKVEGVEKKVDNLDKKQTAHIQVTRAMARDTDVSNERVDEYLVSNGVTMDYFFEGEEVVTDGGEDQSDS